MPITLERHPIPVDVHDIDGVRAWLMDRIRTEVKLKGQPYPKIFLLADGYEETFDLNAMAASQPEADAAATFQALRARPLILRRFLLVRLDAEESKTGREVRFAQLIEEVDGALPSDRRWWTATLPFEMDATTSVGIPSERWMQSGGESDDPALLGPALEPLVVPRPGAQSARFLPPRPAQPDVHAAFGELREHVPPPTDARQMVELATALAAGSLLSGALQGTLVVRICGRSWEQWLLGDELPTDLDSMVRYIANARPPAAEGIALLQVAIRPQDEPPVPGLQVVGELGGKLYETWAPLEFPEGPAGPKRISRVMSRGPRPVPEGGLWLGVDPMVNFELGPMGAVGEA